MSELRLFYDIYRSIFLKYSIWSFRVLLFLLSWSLGFLHVHLLLFLLFLHHHLLGLHFGLLNCIFLHLFFKFLHEERLKWRFVESALDPDSIHFQTGFSILQQFAAESDLYFDQSSFNAQLLQLFLLEVVDANSIVFPIEVIFQFSITFAW